MNKLQRIEEMEKQLAALRAEVEQESKPKRWEPKGGSYKYHDTGSACSNELADKSVDALYSYERLLAYKAEFDADFVPDWDDEDQGKFTLRFHHYLKTWMTAESHTIEMACYVYFSKQAAEDLCNKLNSGEVVL